jgi:outer membrane protein
VTLVTARRDAYVAGFALLATMGMAEARDLDLDGVVLYDPLINYDATRDRVFQFGRDPAPQPQSTTTEETEVQDAEVEPLDGAPVPAQGVQAEMGPAK